ncbi:claspin-like [Anopheles maculipalpis]|uniref:claspin-like n=1 Tax=Anopheles maculipalpis TaxID=1496333 RepID=UPI002158A83C|nr:claspin-like [Anopheles maculipalpis]
MEYDSDSELHATDTLRCDSDSGEDNQSNEGTPEGRDSEKEVVTEATSHATEAGKQLQDYVSTNEHKNSSDESPDVVETSGTNKRRSKFSHLVDSESDEDEMAVKMNDKNDPPQPNVAHLDRLKSLVDSDSGEQQQDDRSEQKKKVKKQIKRKPKPSPALLSESDGEQSNDEARPATKEKQKRKRKKDTKTEVESSSEVKSARDILASLNLFFDDDDDAEQVLPDRIDSGKLVVSASSEDEYNEGLVRSARSARKMTAKEAMADRQIIQSESQRMAREKYIDVPYHRTKVFSFEEFRARKTICKPDPLRDCTGDSAPTNKSIRMTAEQLEEFARKLQERELESQHFFKSESESSDSEPDNNVTTEGKPGNEGRQDNIAPEAHNGKIQEVEVEMVGDTCTVEPLDKLSSSNDISPPPSVTETAKTPGEEPIDPIDEIVNRTSENMEQMMASLKEPETLSTTTATPETEHIEINYDAFTSEARSTTLAAKKAALLASLKLPPCPRLSGSSDMIIDLDSGTVQPKEPSGVDILFQRLAKCSASGQNANSPVSKKSVSILSTENGFVKLDTVSLFEKDERPLVNKEPVPGAAYSKLKQALKEKIDDIRREFIRKREAEFAKKIDLEKADETDDEEEDEEELLEDEQDSEMESDEETVSNAAAGQQNDLLNDHALEEDASAAEESSSSEEGEEEKDEQGVDGGVKKSGRIIKAFEDSDDDDNDAPPAKENHSKERELTVSPSIALTDGDNIASGLSINSEQNEEMLWKDDRANESAEVVEDDLMALCSGQFATQLPQNTQNESLPLSQDRPDTLDQMSQTNAKSLYTQNQQPIGESQLMDLCSGRFETQADELQSVQATTDTTSPQLDSTDKKECAFDDSDVCVGGRLMLDSSDDEAVHKEIEPKSKIKKPKRKHLNISDDEDDELREDEAAIEQLADEVPDPVPDDDEDDEAEEAERYVDYDSEENEVEVRLTKKEKQLITAKFVENEAELSESEWGSADEDERDLDRYDMELGDEEQYDQRQLQQQLEKIHNRQMLDQDDRELEHLKEVFLEDEEKDGVGRERQFRWKNVEKTFSLDYDKTTEQDGDADANGSDDEEMELNWRKMRHERNLLLKEKNIDLGAVDLTATTLLNPADTTIATGNEQENMNQLGSTSCGKKKITIVRKSAASTTVVKEDNPFLISKSTILQGHKASFLSRDQETLNKLASLIPETEGATSTLLTAKARNFVFATLSPAVEKSSKRSLEPEGVEVNANTKKKKTSDKGSFGAKKKLLHSTQ